MPNFGLRVASGRYEVREAIPSSAFSGGDILCFDSNSSLSRMPITWGAPVAGVAKSASTASINNKVPYIVPEADTVFWSECTTGSQFTPGEVFDFEYTSSRFILTTSRNTGPVTVERNTQDVDGQSVRSQVLVKFIRSARSGVGTAVDYRVASGG